MSASTIHVVHTVDSLDSALDVLLAVLAGVGVGSGAVAVAVGLTMLSFRTQLYTDPVADQPWLTPPRTNA